MNIFQKTSLIFCMLLSIATLNQLKAQQTPDPFDMGSCPGAPLTRAQALQYFSPEITERVLVDDPDYFLRTRRCFAELGCGNWTVYNLRDLNANFDVRLSEGSKYTVYLQLTRFDSNTGKAWVRYLANTPELRLEGNSPHYSTVGLPITGRIENLNRNIMVDGYDFRQNNVHFNYPNLELIQFIPSPQVPNVTYKVAEACFWLKASASEMRQDSLNSDYRYELEFVTTSTY